PVADVSTRSPKWSGSNVTQSRTTNKTSSEFDVESMYMSGVRAHMRAHDEAESEKVGSFRVGSGGLFLSQTQIAGTCHRLAMARFLGIPVPRDEIALEGWELRQLMFEAGRK